MTETDTATMSSTGNGQPLPSSATTASCLEEMLRLLERGGGGLAQEVEQLVKDHYSSEAKVSLQI